MSEKVELLAPAGDLERLRVAILYGADAVYIGGEVFGLRANAINFSLDDISEGVKFAHEHNKKVYVTVNIVMHNKEIKHLIGYLKELEIRNVDAIIASDLAIVKCALDNTNLEVHLSTQQSTINSEAALFFKNLGVKRLVLARECSRDDILDVINNASIDVECFIHGAMCSSYSGRCVLSNFFTNRDANRGGCAQICRWDFKLYSENMKPLRGEKDFSFCTKDLSMLKYIDSMIRDGITSFKIEGRMRSLYYVATITSIYRKAIDEYYELGNDYKYNLEYEKILSNCANRDSIAQFYNGKNDYECNYYNGRMEVSNQDFLGIVLGYENGMAIIEQRNYFKKGDVVEIFGPNLKSIIFTINDIYDENHDLIDIVRHPKQIVMIPLKECVAAYDLMRIKN